MKHIVIGDVHGHYDNLRQLLMEMTVIDENNNRINRDTIGVYCSGDLIDGAFNRDGDLLLLDYAEEWFDRVAIGNHEWTFLGGPDFGGARRKDRSLRRKLLSLEARKVYAPAFLVENWLVVHAGLADRWGFRSETDALDAINYAWELSEDETDDTPLLDWIGSSRAGKWGNDTGGIFWLDWHEQRNRNINQIVGHSTIPGGPISTNYNKEGTTHWNIDVGGKTGLCLGGVVIEHGLANPFFWGQRFMYKTKDEDEDEGKRLSEMYRAMMEETS